MLKILKDFLKKCLKIETFMSLTLIISVAAISCNLGKILNNDTASAGETKNKTIIIDPGHGGKDPGKVGNSKLKEKDLNLAISKQLEKKLKRKGYKVVLTRDGDEIKWEDNSSHTKIKELNNRCKIINDTYEKNKESILISIHQNSFSNSSVHGAQSFFYPQSSKSKRLGFIMQDILNEKINTEKPKAPKENSSYYMLINSKCPGIIIECGFLSNYEDESKLRTKEYQSKLAEIIAEGIEQYFN